MTQCRFVALLLGGTLTPLIFPSLMATGQTIQKNTALWYCHDGALLLHAGHGNTSSNFPINWNLSALHKSLHDFQECFRRASDDDYSLQIYAQRGYARATLDIAQVYNFMSLYVLIFKASNPKNVFTKEHQESLRYIRSSIKSLDNATDTFSNLEPDPSDPSDYNSLNEALKDEKNTATGAKNQIVATTFESVPRSKTEFVAFIEAERVPMYDINSEWGLTTEELCPTRTTEITVPDADTNGGKTSIEVAVSADGTLKAAHIVVSSGQSDVDEAALAKAYAYKYHAATRRCVPVASRIIIKP